MKIRKISDFFCAAVLVSSTCVLKGQVPSDLRSISNVEFFILRDEGQFSNGQKQSDPTYFIRGNGAVLALTARQWTWYYVSDTVKYIRGTSHMTFRNASPLARLEDEGNGQYFERHYTVHDDGRPVFSVKKLRVCGLYPGIDLEMFAGEAGLRYEFVVQPGANVSNIQMEFSNDLNITVNQDGIYLARSPLIAISDEIPYIVKPNGDRIACRFKKSGNIISLSIGKNEKLLAQVHQAIRIDPQVIWSTYYRGPMNDFIRAVSIDSSRNVLAVGQTSSLSDMTSPGSHQATYGGGISDAFLVKFDRCGRRLWATYYGGNGTDNALSVATDPSDNIYVAGTTTSLTGVSTIGSHQASNGGGTDGFLVKFDQQGLRLWGTYYGGTNAETTIEVAVNHTGTQILLAGTTLSSGNISTAGSFKPTISNTTATDGFFASFDAMGIRLFGSYFGGALADQIHGVQFDGSGNFYIAGQTASTADIATPGAFSTVHSGDVDGFYAKFSPTGQRIYSSYYGGPASDVIYSIAVRNGLLYLGGTTQSISGIATPGSFKPVLNAGINGFIVQFDTNGTNRNWGTYYGGANTRIFSVATDLSGNVFFGGHTSDPNLATPGSFATNISGFNDLIVGRFTSGGALTWASYYGGPAIEQQSASVVFGFNNTVYIGGTSQGVHTNLGIFGYYGNSAGINSGILGRFFATPLHAEIRAVSKTNLCPNESFVLSFIGGGVGLPTTVVTELSDPAFSFAAPTVIGQLGNYSGGAATITCAIPPAINMGSYLIRIRIQNPAFNSVHFCDTITVLTNGTLTLQQTIDTLCPGDSDTLKINNYTQGSISWFQNGTQIQGAHQTSLLVSQAGQYYALIQHNGCAVYTDTVTYFETNVTGITWTPFSPVCQNDPPITLTNANPAGGVYSGPGVSGNQFNPAAAGPGKHPIQYTLQPTSNCQLTSYDTIEVFQTYNQIISGSICVGQTIVLPDGQQVDQPGTYTVQLLSSDGCDSTLIYVISSVPPAGSLLPKDTNLCEGQTLTLNPGFFQSYQWNTGETTPTITVSERGLYAVTVQDALGCTYTDSILVTTDCYPFIYIPNAFSPNDDRRNDRFKVAVSEYIIYFEMMIFNRWGELVFQTFTADFEWDGVYRGQKLPQGTYPYRIIYEYEISGTRHRKEERGSIHIVR